MRVDPKTLVKRLTGQATRMLEGAAFRAVNAQHYEITCDHVLASMLSMADGEPRALLSAIEAKPDVILESLERAIGRYRPGNAGRPVLAEGLFQWIEATLLSAAMRGETRVRSGAMLLEMCEHPERYSPAAAEALDHVDALALREAVETIDAEESREARPSAAPTAAPSQEGSALSRFTTSFTQKARDGKLDPVLGRHREIRQMVDILARRRKNNPILVGEPGVGKTALVEGLAQSIVKNEVPEPLRGVELLGLDMGLLNAGASVKGELENRLKALIAEVKASKSPIVLFIDEAHTLVAGGADAANLLKPALARGELRTIAATTWAEFKKYFEKDAALERRFQPVKVEEPSEEVAIAMMRGLKATYEKAHDVRIRDEAIEAAVRLSKRYMAGRMLPDKAVDLLDTAAARVRVERVERPEPLTDLEAEISSLDRAISGRKSELEAMSAERDRERLSLEIAELTEKRASLADRSQILAGRIEKERALSRTLMDSLAALDEARREGKDITALELAARKAREALAALPREERMLSPEVDAEAVARTVSAWTGIPVGSMIRDTLKTVLSLDEQLLDRVIGQEAAMTTVAKTLRVAHAGLRNPGAPVGVLLFVGPSGVGKTETALALADRLYGGERFLTTINMSEHQEKHSVSRLVGSPPGYVGYGEGGVLTEAVRQRPYSVVLLDECEKADREVMNLFYQVFDKGTLQDGEGTPVDFRHSLVILTSNLASDVVTEVYADNPSATADDVVAAIRPILSAHFAPALLARMTVVPFAPLGPITMRKIVRAKLDVVCKRIEATHQLRVILEDAVVDSLAARCNTAETGARDADHVLRQTLVPEMARVLLLGMTEERQATSLRIGVSGEAFTATLEG